MSAHDHGQERAADETLGGGADAVEHGLAESFVKARFIGTGAREGNARGGLLWRRPRLAIAPAAFAGACMTIRPLVAGNWKMNGLRASLPVIGEIAKAYDPALRGKADLLVCPPATLLFMAAALCIGSRLRIGAQDCHARESGAHTGDISAEMIADCGADLCDRRPFRAARRPRRDRCRRPRQGGRGAARRADADHLRRRDRDAAPRRRDARDRRRPARRLRAGRRGRGVRDRLRAGLGDRHGADAHGGATSPRSMRISAKSWRGASARRGRARASSMAAPSSRTMPPNSWPCQTSTARWSAGRA